MYARWVGCGLLCAVFTFCQVTEAQNPNRQLNKGKGPKPQRNQDANLGAPPAAAQPAGGGGNFDVAAFTASMLQQFDQDQSGALDQQELQNCLAMLYQQVQQQNQAIAAAARQQALTGLAGRTNGFPGTGITTGNGSQGTGTQANCDQQS